MKTAFFSTDRRNIANSWTAPAKQSDDRAFGRTNGLRVRACLKAGESGVALRLPPQSRTRRGLREGIVPTRLHFGRTPLPAIFAALLVTIMLAGFPADLMAQENDMETATPPTRSMEKLVHLTATVEAIDPAKREVTLKGPLGNLVTLQVSDEVKRLDEIKAGDQVAAMYYIGIVAELRPPTDAEKDKPLVVLSDGERATTGAPAGSGARVIRVVATVEALDRVTGTATLKGPAGRYLTVHVADPKVLERPHIGDTVVVTCTQALAISVKPVNEKSDE